jgi:hypothetical protein
VTDTAHTTNTADTTGATDATDTTDAAGMTNTADMTSPRAATAARKGFSRDTRDAESGRCDKRNNVTTQHGKFLSCPVCSERSITGRRYVKLRTSLCGNCAGRGETGRLR